MTHDPSISANSRAFGMKAFPLGIQRRLLYTLPMRVVLTIGPRGAAAD
jgi:hypothetical protein